LHKGGPQIFKALAFLSYFAGCIGVATTPELRRRSENRLLLFIIGLFSIFFLFLEMTKEVYYLPYLTCFYEGALAVWLAWLWQRKSKRMVAMAVLGVVMVVGAGGALLRIRLNTWGPYARAVEVLKRNSGPNDRIAGSHELGFSIGFTPRFLDDLELGIKNGITPDLILIERIYSGRFETIRMQRPDEYPELMRRLAAYTPIYEQDEYRILKRR
jgi:hypothetical protein